MNILFLGGSNTVMSRGYVDHLLYTLRQVYKFPIDKVENLAVGANSCLHGLEIMKRKADLHDFDIIFIEYCINDFSLATKQCWPAWRAGYEAMLRYAISCRPDVELYCVLLGRRSDFAQNRQTALYKGVIEIAAPYGAKVVHVDKYLRTVVTRTSKEFSGLYSDDAHYARPVAAALAGNFIGSNVASSYAPVHRQALPEPLTPWSFDRAKVVDLIDALALGESAEFSNSRFRLHTTPLRAGESRTVVLPGSLVLLTFASAPDSGAILVEEDGEDPVLFDTLHLKVQSGQFPFIIKSFSFDWKDWKQEGHAHPRKVSLHALSDGDHANARYVKRFHMIPSAIAPLERRVHLSTALCYAPPLAQTESRRPLAASAVA